MPPTKKFVYVGHRHGYCAGLVQSAINYGSTVDPAKADWYIEFTCGDCGAVYLKQQYDTPRYGPFTVVFGDSLQEVITKGEG